MSSINHLENNMQNNMFVEYASMVGNEAPVDFKVHHDYLNSFQIVKSTDKVILGNAEDFVDAKITGLPTLKTTCDAVVMKLLDLDTTTLGKSLSGKNLYYACHWGKEGYNKAEVIPGDIHPAHAIINVADRETADDVAEYLNKLFKSDRIRFPRNEGWHAIATTGNSTPSLSDTDHPFFYYKNTSRMNTKASRILVVKDLACEGLNNKFINVWGAACNMGSVVKGCQRLGRTIRTAAKHGVDTVTVPPMSHDTLYVITHEDYDKTIKTIVKSFNFFNSSLALYGDVVSLDQYINGDIDVDDVDVDLQASLTFWERWRIVNKLGEAVAAGRNPKINNVLKNSIGTKSKNIKKAYATDWAISALSGKAVHSVNDKAINARAEMAKLYVNNTLPDALCGVLRGEQMHINEMDYAECVAWVAAQPYKNIIKEDFDKNIYLTDVNALKRYVGQGVNSTAMEVREKPINRINNMADDLRDNLGVEVYDIVMACCLHRFSSIMSDATAEDFDDEGRLCLPEVTYELRNSSFIERVRGYVISHMLAEGKLNNVFAVLSA